MTSSPRSRRRPYRVVRTEQYRIAREQLSARLAAGADRFRWRARVRANRVTAFVYRSGLTVLALTLIVVGIPLVPLVGPGWALILMGLFLLSTEFSWAQSLTRLVTAEVRAFEQYVRSLPWRVQVPLALLSAAFGWACCYVALLLTGLPSWTPEFVADVLTRLPGIH